MTQLIVTIEDASLLPDLKKADTSLNETTLRAMRDVKEGRTIKCKSFEEYLEKVK